MAEYSQSLASIMYTAMGIRSVYYYTNSYIGKNCHLLTIKYLCSIKCLSDMSLNSYQRSSLREFGVEKILLAAFKVPEALTIPFLEYFARKVEDQVFSGARTMREYSELLAARISNIEDDVKVELVLQRV